MAECKNFTALRYTSIAFREYSTMLRNLGELRLNGSESSSAKIEDWLALEHELISLVNFGLQQHQHVQHRATEDS